MFLAQSRTRCTSTSARYWIDHEPYLNSTGPNTARDGYSYTATKLPGTRLPLRVNTEPCHLGLSLRCSSPAPAAATGFHGSLCRLASADATSSGETVAAACSSIAS